MRVYIIDRLYSFGPIRWNLRVLVPVGAEGKSRMGGGRT